MTINTDKWCDLLNKRYTYLLKSYSTDHYNHEEQVFLMARKAIDWIHKQLQTPNRKVVIYLQEKSSSRHIRSKHWRKLIEVSS